MSNKMLHNETLICLYCVGNWFLLSLMRGGKGSTSHLEFCDLLLLSGSYFHSSYFTILIVEHLFSCYSHKVDLVLRQKTLTLLLPFLNSTFKRQKISLSTSLNKHDRKKFWTSIRSEKVSFSTSFLLTELICFS